MNKEPETYDELMRMKRCVDLTKYYKLSKEEVEKIYEFDTLTGLILQNKKSVLISPASHFVTSEEKIKKAVSRIRAELDRQMEYFEENGSYTLELNGKRIMVIIKRYRKIYSSI